MAGRRSKRVTQEDIVRVLDRLEDLERRAARLEARLRALSGAGPAGPRTDQRVRVASRGRRRPRCPGCTLELPPGRRGEACVWCGFRFDAVRGLLR